MSSLDGRQRGALAQLVATARITLYDDAARTLRGTYGILPDGTVEAEGDLAPDAALRARRRTLEGVLAHLTAEGASTEAAVERLTREVAFTHLNRLLAIRVADALGVISPSLRDGPDSAGFRQWIRDLAPLLATADDTGGYWTYLSQCADELAVDAPALFDPRNPLLALRPSKAAFDTVVGLLTNPGAADIWDADDTFGWAYQFFNTKDERQEMRAGSAAPRDSRELAVRNQFFTPAYVVRFLVHNTLGRRLVDADPTTPLLDQLDHLVDPPRTKGAPVDLADVKVLDPACGSGHFLLGCYDVLEAAWAVQGVSAEEAAARIVPCLWGVDIDPRAVQVAQAAVIFRARRAAGRGPLPPPNVVCARALPEDPAAWAHAAGGLGTELRRLVDAMRAALRDAPILGPLLKAEERLQSEIRATVAGADYTGENLFAAAGIAHDNFGNAERAVLATLQRAADVTSATPAERLLAAGAADAVRFVETVRNRYDAVLMNPPFGEPVAETKDYLRAAYPWIPTRDYNLLAAFVGRGLELCKPEGYLGAITSRAGMFLKTFEEWRTGVLLGHQVVALADLGYGVMEDAMVEAAAYALSPKRSSSDHAGIYIRLLKDADRPAGLAAAIANDRRGGDDRRVFRVASEDFAAIPGSPMAYWMGDSIRRLFVELPRLEGNGGDVRVGLQTGDDFRFVRLFWEVDAHDITQSREMIHSGKRWVPFAKGGEYSPYWSDVHLVVNYERDGESLRRFPGSVIRNPQYYFRPGLTWPERTTSGFSPQVLSAGSVFSVKGPGIIPRDQRSQILLVGVLNSRVIAAIMNGLVPAGEETASGTAGRDYSVGLVQKLPWAGPKLDGERGDLLADRAEELIAVRATVDDADETARRFMCPATLRRAASTLDARIRAALAEYEDAVVRGIDLAFDAERILHGALNLDSDAERYLDEEFGPHPGGYPREPLSADEGSEFARLYQTGIDQVINEVVQARGGARSIATKSYCLDRRLEVLAHIFHRHPRALIDARRRLGLLPPEQPRHTAEDVISYFVGLAVGRWDARGSRQTADFDPLAPVAVCSPAMLVGADGFPTVAVPPGYPLPIPADGVMLDERGHHLDLATAVEEAARAARTGSDSLLADAVSVLGRQSLRDYLAKAFFKQHLGRYSKSRRQAPVYWQLTIPSGGWSAWLYAPRFSREMLYSVVTLADHRLARAAEQIRGLQQDDAMSGRERQKSVDQERTVAAELQEFRDDLARLAGLGWQPDLDDGYVLCAAPLARWFPRNTWTQLGEHLTAIRKGEYPWAAVHDYRTLL